VYQSLTEEDHDDLLEFILKYNKDMQGEGMDGKRTPLDGRQLRRHIVRCLRMSASNFDILFMTRMLPVAFQYARSSSALGINFISIYLQVL